MHKKLARYVFSVYLLITMPGIWAQVDTTKTDSLPASAGVEDSLATKDIAGDSLKIDVDKNNGDALDARVNYSAEDSLEVDLANDIIYLHGNAEVTYKNIKLTADYMEFDMKNKVVYASGVPDSTGALSGQPVFEDGQETFESKSMSYNFRSKRGVIYEVKTPQEGGVLHGDTVKKHQSGNIHMKNGKYTTCDLDHPHFYIAMTKAKIIPKDKIVSGPAYIVVEDIPVPVGLPFGFFPNTAKSASGILIPQYGEEERRGFFLENGGYYFAINDYVDLKATGSIYSLGTWGTSIQSNYKLRYKFSGNLSARYFYNKIGERDLYSPAPTRDISLQWSHRQDPKANPNFSFGANVNFSTTTFDKNHSDNINEYLNNTKNSSVNVQAKLFKTSKYFASNFSGGLTHSQNSLNNQMNMSMPRLSLSTNRIYPFRFEKSSGKKKWYDNISLQYSSSLENKINAIDTVFFQTGEVASINNGFQHSVPLSLLLKPKRLSFFSVSPSMTYKGVLYTNHIDQYIDTETNQLVKDTIPGLTYGHVLLPTISASINQNIYGFFIAKGKDPYFKAMRHVMTPNATVSYRPEWFNSMTDSYYRSYVDSNGNVVDYSIYQGKIYGTPATQGKAASASFSLKNNLELKVRNPKDTVTGEKKVKILETFDFRTSYNIIDKKWTPLTLTGGTRLLNNLINLRFGSTWNQYALDENNIVTEELLWEQGNIGRLVKANMTLGVSLSPETFRRDKGEEEKPARVDRLYNRYYYEYMGYDPLFYEGSYVDFDVPWNLGINYSYNYSKPTVEERVSQTVRINGSISLTDKWKIGFNTGYDMEAKKVTMTNLNIHRDLHCWEMSLSLVPFGQRQSYTFKINVVSPILKDLKFDKKRSWYDRI